MNIIILSVWTRLFLCCVATFKSNGIIQHRTTTPCLQKIQYSQHLVARLLPLVALKWEGRGMMATPSKLSRSKRKGTKKPQRSIISLISDEDDEKENSLDSSVDKSNQGRSRLVNRGRRRESTILAGNLSYQVGIVIQHCSWVLTKYSGERSFGHVCRDLGYQKTEGYSPTTRCSSRRGGRGGGGGS